MSKEISAQLNPTVAAYPGTRQAAWMKTAGIVLAGSALVAVCAHIALPLYFTPVPLSLAPFAVLVIGLFLRPGLAAATLGAYLIEGALGLPVFSPTPAALSATLGSVVILACGALWLAVLTHASLQSVFTLAVLPFLPGDALKVFAAAALAAGWVRLRQRNA